MVGMISAAMRGAAQLSTAGASAKSAGVPALSTDSPV
jgi:hypothetical protein